MTETKVVNGTLPIQRRYINSAVVGGPQQTASPASGSLCYYKQQFPAPILERPSDWNMGIVRFDIPFLRTPRFIDPASDGSGVPCTMTWTNPGGPITTQTQQVSLSLLSYNPDPFNKTSVYIVQTWIAVLQAAMNALATSTGYSSFAPAPLVTYNTATDAISISAAQNTFYPATGGVVFTGAVNMYINAALWRMLPTLPGQFVDYTSLGLSSDYYYLIRLGTNAASAVLTRTMPTASAASPASMGTLNSALVAGSTYTQLVVTGGFNYFLAPGQPITLSDSASGTTQTVFVGALGSRPSSGTINVLLFTANFAFPTVTTSVNIMQLLAIEATATTSIQSGTVLTIQDSSHLPATVTLTQTCSQADGVLFVQPFFPRNFTGGLAQVTVSAVDTVTTETAVPSSWSSISTVRLKTTLIPVNYEMSPDILTSTTSTAGQNTAQLTVVPQVSDFTINQSSVIVTNNIVQFVSEQPRWIDMVGEVPLTAIDFTATWVDTQGVEHPIYCPLGMRFDIKTEFKRKDTKCLPGL